MLIAMLCRLLINKKHFKEYKDDSAAVIYHNDRERIKNNAGKVVELKDRTPNVHKKTKTMKTKILI